MIRLLLSLSMVLVLFSCKKYENELKQNETNEIAASDITANKDFNWRTTSDLQTSIQFSTELTPMEFEVEILDEEKNRIMLLNKAMGESRFDIDQLITSGYNNIYVAVESMGIMKKASIEQSSVTISAMDVNVASAKNIPSDYQLNSFKSNSSTRKSADDDDDDDDDDDGDDDDDDSGDDDDDDNGDDDDDDNGDDDDDDNGDDDDDDNGDGDDDDSGDDDDDDNGDDDDDDNGDDDDDDNGDDDDDDNGDDDDDDDNGGAVKDGNLIYPATGFAFRAYEDLWPAKGDYDFNDMVIKYQYVATTNRRNNITQIDFTITLPALGAGYRNGIGLQFLRKNGNSFERIDGDIFQATQEGASIDDQDPSVAIISPNVFKTIPTYYTNVGDGANADPHTFQVTVFVKGSAQIKVTNFVLDLFLFRSENRGLEVHLPGVPPSNAANPALFGTVDDNSLENGFYRGYDNLPWGLELINVSFWQHPLTRVKIWDAYPQFTTWVNSGGQQAQTWYENPVPELVYSVQ